MVLASLPLALPVGVGAQAAPTGTGDPCPMELPPLASPSEVVSGTPLPSLDLRCIQLFPTRLVPGVRGVVEIQRPPSPFGVTVNADGVHLHDLMARVEGLPDPATLGPFTSYVAWVTPLELDPVLPLGVLTDGSTPLGTVDFPRYMILISAEASPDVTEREGPLVLRGRSPSARMEAHDMLATSPGAEEAMGMGLDAGEVAAARDHGGHAHTAGHGGHAPPLVGGDAPWTMAPGYPGIPMLPGIMALRPTISPYLPLPPGGTLPPLARDREVISLPDGGTLDLEAGFVRRTIAGQELVMLAFNGQHPGPLIRVEEGSTIVVNFRNLTPFHTAVHWHGLRLENRYDGVPGITQDPVEPGGTFQYRVHFPDAGIYWYHPHHREDVQKELGLSGNLLVDSRNPDAYGPVNREEVLLVDDLLLEETGLHPFGAEAANYALMGRFGNTLLVNGSPEWSMEARPGEVVRFHFTNAANTRTFNLSFRRLQDGAASPGPALVGGAGMDPLPLSATPLRMKVLASDVGRFEREEWVESVALAPAERYVVDVHFPEAGRWVLGNHVMGVNHRQGVFRSEVTPMGVVEVAGAPPAEDHGQDFRRLRVHEDVVAEMDRFRPHFHRPVDHELVMSMESLDIPEVVEQAMLYDWVFFNPVEWAGTMPMMNWVVAANQVRWILRELPTGRENEEIQWRFQVGDVVKIRIHNDRGSFHAMQHPLHIHGQRFLVLEQDGVPTENLVWKDTVLLPAGSTTDILLELSNPGRWMVHCHIAEHLEAGMQFIFDVEGGAP
jgi:suppressor of ftsI